MSKKFDFSGYASKYNIKCSDKRTILNDAFKHQDGATVPLVWQHMHNEPSNVLGHALLEHRADGPYAYCAFNDTPQGLNAKKLVEHGDIVSLSIYANKLRQNGNNVMHGNICEVSLVLVGANPGAKIDNLSFAHSDGTYTDVEDEAIMVHYQGGTDIEVPEQEEVVEHAASDKTVQEVFDTYTEEEKEALYTLIGLAVSGETESPVEHADNEGGKPLKEIFEAMSEEKKTVAYAILGYAIQNKDSLDHSGMDDEEITDEKGEEIMKNNVFNNSNNKNEENVLTHAQISAIFEDAKKCGSFKEACLAHAQEYGIENIETLFPEAKNVGSDPNYIKREQDWVAGVIAAVHKSPFSRVKSTIVDMSFEDARARGYVKGTEKKEIYFKASKRKVGPTTVYVKQKIDRDDLIDITDYNVVDMMRMQLREALDYEIARATLIGDGREPGTEGKIPEENIIPVWKEDPLYATTEVMNFDVAKPNYKQLIKDIASTSKHYKGSGNAVFYTTAEHHFEMLWVEDANGRRIYDTEEKLCTALNVSKIVEVPDMDGLTRVYGPEGSTKTHALIGIKVNLKDYSYGTDKGGQVTSFDDFDIDFNQYKYLMEGRLSGALTKPKSAQIYEYVQA